MMRADIRDYVSFLACRELEDMISEAREQEIDLEHLGKRKAEQVQKVEGSKKKPKNFDSRSRGQQGRSHYGKCGKTHDVIFRVGGSDYYKCSKIDHFNRD